MLTINNIFLGDCKEVMQEIDDNSIAACITDPPYNYEFIGHKWDSEEINRRMDRIKESKTLVKNIPYGSGLSGGVRNERWYKKNRDNVIEYQKWCQEWGQEVYRICKPGAFVAVFNSTRTIAHVQVALETAGFYARDCLVYRRHSGIPKGLNIAEKLKKMGSDNAAQWEGWHSCLRNEWESIVILQKPLINNYLETLMKYQVGLFNTISEEGGFQSNIIENIHREKTESFNVHCTVKPVLLMEKLIKMMVPNLKNNIVLDPFAGSGTTLVAAKNLGISYIGIEINSDYVTIANNRLAPIISSNSTTSQSDADCFEKVEML